MEIDSREVEEKSPPPFPKRLIYQTCIMCLREQGEAEQGKREDRAQKPPREQCEHEGGVCWCYPTIPLPPPSSCFPYNGETLTPSLTRSLGLPTE